ncbi:MAG: glutamyl-Q tRNA(Asp) synthetase [Betaproteobacteria bacterium]|jgi:glutamyl-Q tRNA(Asp) synthetase|nr:glutamyl-Q tRNA(Asp) synthetase [Betaproteobacteria bacterium]
MTPTGRFAPSPSGPLHFGSLVAALASWLDARAAGGRWLVRIEDLDEPRVQRGAADGILRTLERLGLYWDAEVVFQSRRTALYEQALTRLEGTYLCGCSRREIADSAVSLAADGAQVYPGTCRAGLAQGRTARALRIRVAGTVSLVDRAQGPLNQDLERQVGDFVLRRADGQFAYQLAVVVDDADQGVTDVVRGADLLDSTPRQIYLQRLLGLPTPRYLHVPVAVDPRGEKLSKQTRAGGIGQDDLRRALLFLGQPASETLAEAVRTWDPRLIPAQRAREGPR